MSDIKPQRMNLAELVQRARGLANRGDRCILGIVGAPGAGKSTVAEALIAELGSSAALVSMDGYHLANEVLDDLGRRSRKGAPDTFDVDGYVALLHRLRDQQESVIYAPRFHRQLEEPIGSCIPVHPETPLVITEGNYLLLPDEPWGGIRALLDEAWFLKPDESLRQERLIARHVEFGREPEAARAWALGTDLKNAELVSRTAGAADLIVAVND